MLSDRTIKVRTTKIFNAIKNYNINGHDTLYSILKDIELNIVRKYFLDPSDYHKFMAENNDRYAAEMIRITREYYGLCDSDKLKDEVRTARPTIKVVAKSSVEEKRKSVKKATKKVRTGTDIVFSFDDTGSMAACRHSVRKMIDELSAELLVKFGDELNVGLMIHGDYCDGPKPVVRLDLGKDWVAIKRFLTAERNFSGGDAPECYEAALKESKQFDWRVNAHKYLVMIGDEVPHEPSYKLNTDKLDWRREVSDLQVMGVKIISIQALNNKHANGFYSSMASMTDGYHLQLTQINQINALIRAICYQTNDRLEEFEDLIAKTEEGKSRAFRRNIDVLAGRPTDVKIVEGLSDFQIFNVDKDTPIKQFVEDLGLEFKRGSGYYEFNKPEYVQDYKNVVVQDRETEVFYSDQDGRELLGLSAHGTVRINPKDSEKKYRFFIQSTSVNRVLKAGTTFLYDNR